MVRADNFEEFYEEAAGLFVSDPLRTRYVARYRHHDSKVTLKVTNDVECVQYSTDCISDVKKVERLNMLLLTHAPMSASGHAEVKP